MDIMSTPLKLRWSEQKTVKFVQLYRDHENLWNTLNPEYRNRDSRNMSLQIIIEELGDPSLSLTDVSRKIKALRSTYHLELVKMEKNKAKYQGKDYIYKTTLQWFNDMHFIMKATGNKEDADKMENIQCPEIEVEEKSAQNSPTNSNTEEDFDSAPAEMCEPILTPEQPPVRSPVSSSTGGRKATLKRLALAKNRVLNKMRPISMKPVNIAPQQIKLALQQVPQFVKWPINNAPQALVKFSNDKPSSSTTENHEDECEIMGKHIAIQLRELPVQDRVRANFEIQKILMDFRLRNLNPELIQSTQIISPHKEHSSIY